MLVEARQDLQTSRGVVNLVKRAPEKLRFVAKTVPPVVDKGRENINEHRGSPRPKLGTDLKEGPVRQPPIPSVTRQNGDSELDGINEQDPRPPCPDFWKVHGRPEAFDQHAPGGDGE